MPLATAIKNLLLDSLPSITHVSAHTGLPDDSGSNEVTGGTYSRAAISFQPASDGMRISPTSPVLPIPSGTIVSFLGFWSTGTFIGSTQVASAPFGADGTYTVTVATLSL